MKVQNLSLRKYMRLREIHGHTQAVRMLTEKELEIIHDLLVCCAVPDNYHEESGGFVIRENNVINDRSQFEEGLI